MKKLLVLGAGTAGTMIANKLRRRLADDEWGITLVDQDATHYYQPGFLFLPFGVYGADDVRKPRKAFVPSGVDLVMGEIELIEPDKDRVLVAGGHVLPYDRLIIATGTHPRPDQTPGLEGAAWRDTIHDFYTFDGAMALADRLARWDGGRLVVNIMELPFKCPVAPIEFSFLADWFFHRSGMRDRVELTYMTPLEGAFTKPVCSQKLTHLFSEKNIDLVTDFTVESVDPDRQVVVSYDEREVPYDLLVTVPVNMGADVVGRSGLGDELNHVPVNKHTFLADGHENIWALGDAANLPTSKAGSVAHFAADVFTENFVDHARGLPMKESFDGHTNCFIESGFGKALLVDFDYETEPYPGKFPVPRVGPFSLLKESTVNHWGKLMFRWTYWNVLLPGRRLPVPTPFSMAGKRKPGDVPALTSSPSF